MNVKLIAHTKLEDRFHGSLIDFGEECLDESQVVTLTAIRTCYSHLKPTEIVKQEKHKYFSKKATDGENGTEADRLIRQIIKSKHTSTLEHLNYTFAIEGVSRSLLAQLTRHRHMSFSVQSQRYVKMGSDDKSEGFDYVNPNIEEGTRSAHIYDVAMQQAQYAYDQLRKEGVSAEDARMVLPNAATCNMVMT